MENKDEVSPQQMEELFRGPSLACNKFFLTISPAGIRFTFTESAPNSDIANFRTSVTMDPVEAIRVKRLLSRVLKDLEASFVKSGAIGIEEE